MCSIVYGTGSNINLLTNRYASYKHSGMYHMEIYLNLLIKKKKKRVRRNTITSYENHVIKEEAEDEEENMRILARFQIMNVFPL